MTAAGGAVWEDLDPLEFERLRHLAGAAGSSADQLLATLSDREIARALGVAPRDKEVTTGALLLFGKIESLRLHVPTHEAAFQVLQGLEVEVNDFLPYPLFRLMEELIGRFRARNQEQELELGLLRVGVPTYSPPAFREALANALIHRDYTKRGAVHVQWNPEQLELSSPGGFPPGVTLDNLLVTPPHPRSPTGRRLQESRTGGAHRPRHQPDVRGATPRGAGGPGLRTQHRRPCGCRPTGW